MQQGTNGVDRTHRVAALLLVVVGTSLLVLGIYHGLLQVLYRAGWLRAASFLGLDYYQGLTLHGVVNAIVYTTFFEVAFGYVVVGHFLRVPLNAGVTGLAVGLMLVGTLMAAIPILAGKASVLYTFYPPLKASPWFYLGASLLVVGSWVPFFQWIAAYLQWRRLHPDKAAPLAVVGMLATFTVWLIATIPLAVEVLVLLLPWSLGWTKSVDVVLARTLFWFFGHPLVYFWLLPAYVMYYVMLPPLVGGKLFSDKAARLAFLLFIVFSAPVGLHHQYADPGVSSSYKWLHGIFTFCVAIPSFITAFTVAATFEHGARRNGGQGLFGWWAKLPYFDQQRYLFAYGFMGLVLFLFGGITGIVNASVTMNNVVHNTAWIPGHFHTTLGGPVFLAFLGLSVWMLTELWGKELRLPRWNLMVPYVWTAGVALFSIGLSVAGVMGEPRRTNMALSYSNPDSPLFQARWELWTQLGAVGGILMTLAMVVYFAVFFSTLFAPVRVVGEIRFPTAEPLRPESLGATRNFTPWVIVAVIFLIIAYAPPLLEVLRGSTVPSPPFEPFSPVPVTR
ncbi:MAG: cbb3-type cytochrome c oxidase subunit I [Candidatus Binatia bacterium]|nr:cbb3-type cytochrome c oxidase subunit I [Candidatus Binatia bacterium]